MEGSGRSLSRTASALQALTYAVPHLAGAIDILVVQQPDGSLKTSPFYVRFGKYTGLRTQDKRVSIAVNDCQLDFCMHLGRTGEVYFVTEVEEEVDGDMSAAEAEAVSEAVLDGMASPPLGYSDEEDAAASPRMKRTPLVPHTPHLGLHSDGGQGNARQGDERRMWEGVLQSRAARRSLSEPPVRTVPRSAEQGSPSGHAAIDAWRDQDFHTPRTSMDLTPAASTWLAPERRVVCAAEASQRLPGGSTAAASLLTAGTSRTQGRAASGEAGGGPSPRSPGRLEQKKQRMQSPENENPNENRAEGQAGQGVAISEEVNHQLSPASPEQEAAEQLGARVDPRTQQPRLMGPWRVGAPGSTSERDTSPAGPSWRGGANGSFPAEGDAAVGAAPRDAQGSCPGSKGPRGGVCPSAPPLGVPEPVVSEGVLTCGSGQEAVAGRGAADAASAQGGGVPTESAEFGVSLELHLGGADGHGGALGEAEPLGQCMTPGAVAGQDSGVSEGQQRSGEVGEASSPLEGAVPDGAHQSGGDGAGDTGAGFKGGGSKGKGGEGPPQGLIREAVRRLTDEGWEGGELQLRGAADAPPWAALSNGSVHGAREHQGSGEGASRGGWREPGEDAGGNPAAPAVPIGAVKVQGGLEEGQGGVHADGGATLRCSAAAPGAMNAAAAGAEGPPVGGTVDQADDQEQMVQGGGPLSGSLPAPDVHEYSTSHPQQAQQVQPVAPARSLPVSIPHTAAARHAQWPQQAGAERAVSPLALGSPSGGGEGSPGGDTGSTGEGPPFSVAHHPIDQTRPSNQAEPRSSMSSDSRGRDDGDAIGTVGPTSPASTPDRSSSLPRTQSALTAALLDAAPFPTPSCQLPARSASEAAALDALGSPTWQGLPEGTGGGVVLEGGMELSLCWGMLNPQMPAAEVAALFARHLVGPEQYLQQGKELLSHPDLACRLGNRVCRWEEALPVVVGAATFGPGVASALKEGIREAYPTLDPRQRGQLPSSPSAHLRPTLDQSGTSWRGWLFGSWRSSSSRRDAAQQAEQAQQQQGQAGEGGVQEGPGAELEGGVVEEEERDAPPQEEVPLTQEAALLMAAAEGQASDAVAVEGAGVRVGAGGRQFVRLKRRSFVPTPDQLREMGEHLQQGQNTITFTYGKQHLRAYVYVVHWSVRLVISDIDGTITKSDVLGHLGHLLGYDWTHAGITRVFSGIRSNGYHLLFLSSRSIGQASITRDYLHSLEQNGTGMPHGPVIISPDGLFPSLYREVILRRPHEFKIRCLEDIKSLFPPEWNPFYAGFGNRDTDEISYLAVGVPPSKVFIINPKGELRKASSHARTSTWSRLDSLLELLHPMFPPIRSQVQAQQAQRGEEGGHEEGAGGAAGMAVQATEEREEFNDYNYWRVAPPIVVGSDDEEWGDPEAEGGFESAGEGAEGEDEDAAGGTRMCG